MKLFKNALAWLVLGYHFVRDFWAPPAVEVPVDVAPTELEPLSAGDVVRTQLGPLSVLGVDQEGVAWCWPMLRTNRGYEFLEVIKLDAKGNACHRVAGVKHCFEAMTS